MYKYAVIVQNAGEDCGDINNMRGSQDRLKGLFLPAWYLSEVNLVAAIFEPEKARRLGFVYKGIGYP